ncbi:MAG: tetratricopeptide repeat protein [Sulfuricellaceae bacterium]
MNPSRLFLSYTWRDAAAVEALARELEKREVRVFLDRWYLTPGQPWQDELEAQLAQCDAVAVCLGPHGMGNWQQREKGAALIRQGVQPGFPVIPVLLPGGSPSPGFLELNTWVDLRVRDGYELGLDTLVKAARGEPPGAEMRAGAARLRAEICPYRGLNFFREEDAAYYFGRETAADDLARMVCQKSCIALVGASGSGKSSLLRAGLLPRLRGDTAAPWEFATLTPGENPLRQLAAALTPLLQPELDEIDRIAKNTQLAELLRAPAGAENLKEVLNGIFIRQKGAERLLLTVDQWEEIDSPAGNEAERQAFIALLLVLSADPRCCVLLAVRGDCFDSILKRRALSDRVVVVQLAPMTDDELHRAVIEPARLAGLEFEAGLAETILADAAAQPGALPLLEFVLHEVWQRRQGMRLHLEGYRNAGGFSGAIGHHAQGVWDSLDDAERAAAKHLFPHLANPDDGKAAAATRRRPRYDDIPPAGRALLAKLTDARLLSAGHDHANGAATVELAHEALLGQWPALRDWLADNRDFLNWLARFENARREWLQTDRETAALLGGARLAEALRRQETHRDHLTAEQNAYITTSREREKALEADELARLRREVAMVSKLKIAGAALLLLLLVAVGSGVYAWRKAVEAGRRAAEAEQATDVLEHMVTGADPAELGNDIAVQRAAGKTDTTGLAKDLIVGHLLDPLAARVEKEFSGQPLVAARLHGALGAFYEDWGEFATAKQHAQHALEIRRRLLGDQHPDTLTAMINLASTIWELGDLAGARVLEEQALAGRRRILGAEHPDTLVAMNNLAETLYKQGDLPAARDLHEKTLEIRNRVLGKGHADTLISMNNLAETLYKQGDLPAARTLLEKTLEIRRRVHGKEDANTLNAMNNLARIQRAQGDLPGARDLLEKTLEIRRRVQGDQHPYTLVSMNYLAETLRAQGDLRGARDLNKKNLETARHVLGAEHPTTSASAYGLHETLLALKDSATAQAVYREHLAWLMTRPPDSLADAKQREIRKKLEERYGSAGR